MGQRLEHARALYVQAIRDGDYVAAINAHAGDRYTQHSTPVRDGREGFIEFFADFVERNPVREIEIVRSFEDGRPVLILRGAVRADRVRCQATAVPTSSSTRAPTASVQATIA